VEANTEWWYRYQLLYSQVSINRTWW